MRSTTQRQRPRPEPRSVVRRAISGVTPRAEFASTTVVVVASVTSDGDGVAMAVGYLPLATLASVDLCGAQGIAARLTVD